MTWTNSFPTLAPPGHLDEGEQVAQMAVHAAVGHEADEVERIAAASDAIHRRDERRVLEKITVADALVDAREVLVDDAAGAHVHVADLGVAHLARRQADGFARGDELGVRIAHEQLVEHGRPRHRDGVVRALGADAPAVEDDQGDGRLSDRAHASCLIAARPAYRALVPSSSSIRSSWLYFATRSERLAEPVLI